MADLLLELFSEEIPARMQKDAAEALDKALAGALDTAGLKASARATFVTPRRLALRVEGLPTQQADVNTERKGPKLDAPQAALDGFLKSTGLTVDQLEKRDGVYFAKIHQKGRATAEVLAEAINKILAEFTWPKSMRWGAHEVRWVRPLHSILCIFDGKVLPVTFGPVKAGNVTYGHRFLAPAAITISDAKEYETKLKAAKVLADREERKALIKAKANELAMSKGYSVKPDEGLLEEVTGLVEWPVLLMGSIDQKFMDLPQEVLVSEMRAHQKYFALLAKDGSLADKFLITANMETKDGGKAVIAGNERVLRARLSDGRFFWDQDRKKTLDAWGEGLKTVTYHAKIGTIAEKVDRVAKLAASLAPKVKGADAKKVERAAKLAKADLVTGMVGEFPELQGVMGRYYAIAQKEPAEVADAIRDHYKPLGPTDGVPSEPTAICVALADKLDTITGLFAIGEKPTGSKDPFALRRAALGIIRIILDNQLRLSLKDSLKLNDELLAFFGDRLKVQLKDQGVRHDLITAVFDLGEDDLVRLTARVKALQEFLGTDDGANLLAAYKRAANILAIEEKKDKKTYNQPVDSKQLKLTEETALFAALEKTLGAAKPLLAKEDYKGAMAAFSSLRAPVDSFFDKVLVNDKDAATRENRLNLLAQLRATMDAVANFAVVESPSEKKAMAA